MPFSSSFTATTRARIRERFEFLWVAAAVGALTAAGFLFPTRYYVSVGLLYLLLIVCLSLWVGRWPMLLAGVLSAFCWEYFYIEPRFQFRISSLQDGLMFLVYLAVALIAGQLIDRVRRQARNERLVEERETLVRALLGSVSHEIRTPLAVMRATLEALEIAPAPVRAQLAAEARTAADRLDRLVRNLLDQTRIESGELKPHLDWCDIQDLVNSALEIVGGELAGRPVAVDIPDEMPPVRADFTLMERAVANLLLNVARHTPSGTPVALSARMGDGGGRAYLTVSDRGPGLPPALREGGFGKFAQVRSTGGLGLGLSIVRGFVSAQGGTLEYRDHPEGGAVFTISLPYAAPPAGASE